MTRDFRIVQVAHGRLIPQYSSAYALRCIRYLSHFKNRLVLSTGGLIFHDEEREGVKQYRSIIMTGLAFLKGGRALEIYLSKGKFLRKKYLKDLFSAVKNSKVVVFEGPWQFYLLRDVLEEKVVIYDAHNVEASLRKGTRYEEYTEKLESALVKRADHVITVSEEDASLMSTLYGKDIRSVTPIPDGFENPACTWAGSESKDVVFIGSAYMPNLEAAKNVIMIAGQKPEYNFKIIGSVCNSLKKRSIPSNVKLLGIIDESTKEKEICTSFLALNPVERGSGVNVKMLDYISHGIPIITTEIGTRGFEAEIKETFTICNINDFSGAIESAQNNKQSLKNKSFQMLQYSKGLNYEKTRESAAELIRTLVDEQLNNSVLK